MLKKLHQKYQFIKKDKHFFEILNGSIWSFGSKIMAVILGLVLTLMITRLYGAEAQGTFALINSFFVITGIIALMGTNTALLRLVPEYTAKYTSFAAIQVYWKIVGLIALMSILISLLTYYFSDTIASKIFNQPSIASLFALASVLIIFHALSTLNTSAFRAFRQIKLYAFYQLLTPSIKVLMLGFFSIFSMQVQNPVYALFASLILLATVSTILVKLKTNELKAGDVPNLSYKGMSSYSILALSFPMFLTASMHIIMSQTDIVMLGAMESVVVVGIYAVVVKLAALTSFVLGTVNTMAAPKFSELYHSGNMEALESVSKKSSKMLFYATLPIAFVLIVLGKILLGIFGEEYEAGYLALLILVIGQFVNAFVGSVGFFLNMTGYQKELNKMVLFAAVINIILNYVLIPIYGINGAAVATAISLSTWNILAAFYIKRKFGFFIHYDFNIRKRVI